MHEGRATLLGHDPVELSRSGYTGGDGFELALPAELAEELVERLLDEPEVGLSGLAARDSLRLEAGVCLYGHDLDPATTPVEAGLMWAIPKARRTAGAGYPGAEVIARQMAEGAPAPPGRPAPARAPARARGRRAARPATARVGVVTSGGYGPVLAAPIAMGYVETGAGRRRAAHRACSGGRAEGVHHRAAALRAQGLPPVSAAPATCRADPPRRNAPIEPTAHVPGGPHAMSDRPTLVELEDHDGFRRRHLGLTADDRAVMLATLASQRPRRTSSRTPSRRRSAPGSPWSCRPPARETETARAAAPPRRRATRCSRR